MASNTFTVSAIGTVFDATSQRKGTITFFCNDLNIGWSIIAQAPGVLQRLHTGPILFATTASVGGSVRVTATAQSIGSAFPPPQGLSLLQVQTDAYTQI